jgi:hypothetical protein
MVHSHKHKETWKKRRPRRQSVFPIVKDLLPYTNTIGHPPQSAERMPYLENGFSILSMYSFSSSQVIQGRADPSSHTLYWSLNS